MSDHHEEEKKSRFTNRFILPIILLAVIFWALWTLTSGHEHHVHGHADHYGENGHHATAVSNDHGHQHHHQGESHDHAHDEGHHDESDAENMGAIDEFGNWVSAVGKAIQINLGENNLDVGSKSTEAKLHEFLNGTQEVSEDKSQGWITCDRVFFETGSSNLSESSNNQLDNLSTILNHYSDATIKLGGYTDSSGDREVNMTLSKERAVAAMNALANRGISADRISAEGYGPDHPVASNDTKSGMAQNRRVDIRVTSK